MSTMKVTNLKHESSGVNNIVLNSDGSVGGELATTLASKVDYALPTNAQTGTTYTFVAADAEKLTTASNAAAVTLTIPPASSVAWPDNTVLRVVNYGAGAVTIDGGSGVTVTNTASTIAQYGAAVAIRTASDAWTVVPFGGGDVPAAEVSSPAATGQYTDTGITYDYYTFTASGTLTVDTAGFADVLVIGGGAGGGVGNNTGGGGGAGGFLYLTDAYLPAGALSIVVGAGGGAGTTTGASSSGNVGGASHIATRYISPGGGPGSGQDGGSETRAQGFDGASGGGACALGSSKPGGSGVSGLGNDGAGNTSTNGGGGGGAGSAGSGTTGGSGSSSSITGSAVTYAAGGNAGGGASGSANSGNGGQGSTTNGSNGGAGGSGVVIVRVKV